VREMILPRLRRHRSTATVGDGTTPIDARELARMFAAPRWLRDLGFVAWFVVGLGLVLFGLIWLLAELSTIVLPLVTGTIVAAVAGPAVSRLQERGLPRALGAAVILLGLLALALVVVLLVLNGIVAEADQIRALAASAADTLAGWADDIGADGASAASDQAKEDVPAIGETLLKGVAGGIAGLTSVVFLLSLTLFSTFFLLKDGPAIRRFVDRHLGIPQDVARMVTGNVLASLRRYFLGVTIVAAFNAVVVGLGAWVLGVPLAATIAVVTFVTAYVPYIGAVVSGALAVVLALASEGTGVALVMLVIVILANGLLQNIVQPIAFGATLGLNPLAVLVVTIGAGALFGMIGMVLAAPIASAAAHIARELALARTTATTETAPEAPRVAAGSGG
jgi:putative heme transporter